MRKHKPIRTCIGCGQKSEKDQLLRIVCCNHRLIPDPDATRPGRGTYLCFRPECLKKAVKRGRFYRFCKSTVTEAFIAELEEMISGNEN